MVIGRPNPGKPDVMHISRKCVNTGSIQHEMLHGLGLAHEQIRPDRDQFIKINWRNIERSKFKNYRKVGTNFSRWEYRDLDTPYDMLSVMHYSSYYHRRTPFSGPTITLRKNGVDTRKPTLTQHKDAVF